MTVFDTLTLTLTGHTVIATTEELGLEPGQELGQEQDQVPGNHQEAERSDKPPAARPLERTVWGVWVAVNGKPLFGDRVVSDVLALLFDGANAGELTLLSCSCGVPECAGFMEPVQVQVTPCAESSDGWAVAWRLPVEGYGRCVVKDWGEGPWAFRFERAQVLAELERFSRSLAGQHERTGALYLSPCEPFCEFEKPLDKLPALLAQALEHRQGWPAA